MQRRHRLADLLIVCFVLGGMMVSPAEGALVTRVGMEANKDGTAHVVVNNRKTIHLRTANGTLSPSERANIVVTRLTALAQKGIDPKAIWYKQVGRSAHVMVGDTMLLIATVDEGRVRKMRPVDLAKMWVENLRNVLSLPPLSASPASLTVPLGERRTVVVESLLTDPVSAEVSNPNVIALDAQAKPGSLVVTGASVGDTSINLRCGEYTAQVQVSVKKYAAYAVPGVAKAMVTGWNAPAALVSRAASDAAHRAISLEPGAKVRSLSHQPIVQELAPGQTIRTAVQVEVAGGDYIPAKLTAQVEVENKPLPRVPTSWIMYSNDPERVLRYQTLFAGRMSSTEEAIRLLYHHQNMMDRRIGFVIDVVNPSSSPASIHVVEGISQPMVDTVAVGYKAGLEFLESHRNGVGRVIEIPARSRRALVSQPLDRSYTASGILEMRQLSGDELSVRVTAKPEDQRVAEDPLEMAVSAAGIDPSRFAPSDHVYPGPVKDLDVTYTAGKPWVFLRIGKYALKHATQDKQLYGNYGVTYDIKATLENPSSGEHTVELCFEATAGPVSGVFLVDGSLIRIKYLRPPGEATIARVTVPAGRSRVVSIRTIPLSGSAYPATLIIRPASGSTSAAAAR